MRSPSPPPQAPMSLEPGPRAQNLNKVFSGALNHTISTCSYAQFATCFPTPARYNKPLLESVLRQVQNMIENRSRREFDEILSEKDVVRGLNELDGLLSEAKTRRERKEDSSHQVLHELPPQQLFLAHLTPYLKETQTKLEDQLGGVQQENSGLAVQVKEQEEVIERLVGRLETALADVEGGNNVLQQLAEHEKLKADAREIDAELAKRKDGHSSRL